MTMKSKSSKRAGRTLSLVLIQILLTVAVLACFDLFHHVLPERKQQREGMIQPIGTVAGTAFAAEPEATAVAETAAEPEPTAAAEEMLVQTAESAPAVAPELTAEPAPPTLRERFADRFTAETIVTDSAYTSANLAVSVEKVERPAAFPDMTYFVADIYVADVDCFRAAFPLNGTYAEAKYIARGNEAVLAVNGDCMIAIQQGLVVRNGMIYQSSPGISDYCILYPDGSMATLGSGTCTEEEILAQGPLQVWQFGPMLLDGNGEPLEEFNISSSLLAKNPRTALGYYEPGHYCFVVVDGRQGGYSDGATMEEMARLMSSLGCTAAFNLDGGASSAMVFRGELVNRPSGTREINDLLIIREPEGVQDETP